MHIANFNVNKTPCSATVACTLHITAVGHRGVTMSQLSPAHLQSSARRESRGSRGSKQREQSKQRDMVDLPAPRLCRLARPDTTHKFGFHLTGQKNKPGIIRTDPDQRQRDVINTLY